MSGSHGKTPPPQLLVSLKEAVETMGREAQINEKDILGAREFLCSAAKRATGLIFGVEVLPTSHFPPRKLSKKVGSCVFQIIQSGAPHMCI